MNARGVSKGETKVTAINLNTKLLNINHHWCSFMLWWQHQGSGLACSLPGKLLHLASPLTPTGSLLNKDIN